MPANVVDAYYNQYVTALAIALFISNLRLERSSFRGRYLCPSIRAVTPRGMLMANNQCHELTASMALAMEGPAAADMATTIALIPIPRPIWLRG